jgi:hypothetical protein
LCAPKLFSYNYTSQNLLWPWFFLYFLVICIFGNIYSSHSSIYLYMSIWIHNYQRTFYK